ncbi:MAG: 3' terminal RNA ribose 2'-O-methyltransferase Hen1 [Anaerolineales bacterium]|nr:3' terminal RNA ribose 2'-O-methyltransferase Hen1 [Anaerolineales bacterium]
MLLTITTTHTPATDLGYLLGKHPARVQTFPLNFGQAHVFYPEATETRCTAALLLDIDPIGLVRGDSEWFGRTFALGQYVNDRPYAASSFMSVAIAQVYRNALKGQAKEHATLAQTPLPLQAMITPLPSRGGRNSSSGAALLDRLFTPLGYTLTVERHPLDPQFSDWGDSRYYTLTLANTCRLQDLLAHLYVLIPVLDDEKHYWVGEDEVQKLLAFGGDWLRTHPERDLITARYLRHRRHLIRTALAQLLEDQPEPEPEETAEAETTLEQRINLHEQRLGTVLSVLRQSGAHRVLDLGCGEGKLLRKLLEDRQFTEIVGMDVSHQTLEIAADRLRLDSLPEKQRARIHLMHGSLTYRDQRLAGFDAAAVVEVIEHLDPPRLAAFARVLFEYARPGTVVLTTPNAEYNVKFDTLPEGKFRHRDHRFEWTRAEFQTWADAVATQHGYTVRYLPLGPEDPLVGAPSQIAVFTRPA